MADLTTSELIELAVALGTLALASATVGIVVEARRTRIKEHQRRIQASFRSGIIEQLDNARALMAADPARGSDHVGRYLFPLRLRFETIERLLGAETLPADLSAYLLWSVGRCRTYSVRLHDTLEETARINERLADSPARAQWTTLLDEVQVIACLLIAQAKRESDLAPLRSEFAETPWTRPTRGAPNARTLARAQDLLAPGRPAWPAGDCYDRCREPARDDEAATAAAAQDNEFAVAVKQPT